MSGSKTVNLVHCPCEFEEQTKVHTWPLAQGDQKGLELGIFLMLERGLEITCIEKDIRLDLILLNSEIQMAIDKGWLPKDIREQIRAKEGNK